jgi:hypothetical protein
MINAFFIEIVTFTIMPAEWYLVAGMIVVIISPGRNMEL